MKIDHRHHKVAETLATAPTIRAAARAGNVSPSTVLRWQRLPEFQELIRAYTPEGRAANLLTAIEEQQENLSLLRAAEEDELLITSELQEMIEKMLSIIKTRLDSMDETEIQDIPLRLLSPFMNTTMEAVKLLQNSNDRLTGYTIVLDEINKILAPHKISNLN